MTPGAPTSSNAAAQLVAIALHQPAVGQTLFMAESYVAPGPPPFSLTSQTGIGTLPAMYGNILYTSEGFSDAVVWQVPPQAPKGGTMLIPQVPYLWAPGFYYQAVPSTPGPSTIPSVGSLINGIVGTGLVSDGAGIGYIPGVSNNFVFTVGYTGGGEGAVVAVAVQQSQPSVITVTDSVGNAYRQVEQLVIPRPAWVSTSLVPSGIILTVFICDQYPNIPPGTVVTVSGFVSGDTEAATCGLVLGANSGDPLLYTLTQPEVVQLYPDPTNQAPYALLSTVDPWQNNGLVYYVSFASVAVAVPPSSLNNAYGPLPIGGATPVYLQPTGNHYQILVSIGTTAYLTSTSTHGAFGNAISVGWMTGPEYLGLNGSPFMCGGQVVMVMGSPPVGLNSPWDVLQLLPCGLWTTGPVTLVNQEFDDAVFTSPPTEQTDTTGSGTALLGANCPATTPTAPYTWMVIITSDGSSGFIPIWK